MQTTDPYEKYRVEVNGEVSYVNHKLVEARGISDASLHVIKTLHAKRMVLFQRAKTAQPPDLRRSVTELEDIEYELQDLWGFRHNRDFHRWFDLPGCTCPKLDNEDRLGTPYRVYNARCPAHGTNQD